MMFATTKSAFPSTTSKRLPSSISILLTSLKIKFSFAESTATGSKSTPTTCLAPSLAATIARIPEPVPISKTTVSSFVYLSKAATHILVVS
ncbi:hypothetical protein D3C76_1678040 [compost metagenome]